MYSIRDFEQLYNIFSNSFKSDNDKFSFIVNQEYLGSIQKLASVAQESMVSLKKPNSFEATKLAGREPLFRQIVLNFYISLLSGLQSSDFAVEARKY